LAREGACLLDHAGDLEHAIREGRPRNEIDQLDLKLDIGRKVLILMDVALPGRCRTPRFTPQKSWAAVSRHEALRVSSFNLATNCNLISPIFVTSGSRPLRH
jgi:hypothetical protein